MRAAVRREIDHRRELALMAVHAARREQAQHMNGRAAGILTRADLLESLAR